jgi:CHAD domain-containing protein
MSSRIFQHALSSQRRFRPLLDRVREDFQVARETPQRFRRHYYDTFDWRLYDADCTLEFDELPEPRARLCAIGETGPLLEQAIKELPEWFRAFPGRTLRPELSRLAKQRALIRIGAVDVRASPYEIRNRAGKILGHLAKEQILDGKRGGRGRTVATTVRILPLRGYEEVAEEMLAGVEDSAAGPAGSAFHAALRLLRRTAGDYSSRLRVPLSKAQSTRQALASVLLFLLDLAERNLEGVEADIDTEFLHDFRISCRRSRSLITQVRGVLPPAELARFRSAFSWLSVLTGPQRDLDVFLLALPDYASALEARPRTALEPLQRLLEAERERVHRHLVQELRSERFAAFQREWRAFLVAAARTRTARSAGSEPVTVAVGAAIWRVYRRLLRDGRAAGTGGYSEALHELRKTAKKLRYLLEAFRALYPETDIEAVIAALRKLQNVLGDIVDCAVQQSYLREWGVALAARGSLPAATAGALAELGAARAAAGAAAQRKFHDRFAAFADHGTGTRMRRLFRGK